MKASFLPLLWVVVATGCGAQTDSTANRPDSTIPDGYPAGPYGYIVGSTVENIDFLGKLPTSGATASTSLYSGLSMQPVSLNDFHKNPDIKVLYLVGVARWCTPCNEEQPTVRANAAEFASQGVQLVEMVAESDTVGVPASASDIDTWGDLWPDGIAEGNGGGHALTSPIVIDPYNKMAQYANISAYPLAMAVRTDTMTIAYMCVGGQCDHKTALAALVQ